MYSVTKHLLGGTSTKRAYGGESSCDRNLFNAVITLQLLHVFCSSFPRPFLSLRKGCGETNMCCTVHWEIFTLLNFCKFCELRLSHKNFSRKNLCRQLVGAVIVGRDILLS